MITQERVRELFDYDPKTGRFFWRVAKARRVRVGDIAGSIDGSDGYWKLRIDGKFYRAHRIVWLLMTGKLPDNQIDHINCVRRDNRFVNLRHATLAQNCRNAVKRRDNSSGAKGVYYYKPIRRWRARIQVDGVVKSLGYFDCLLDAELAYSAAAMKYFGEFARVA